ncbi:MAG: hypothetical protein M1837_004844 [Sclerophora amabilis]|nr:MAG: hypothetical protein M1837_004844 [Sclerophora amabilis]
MKKPFQVNEAERRASVSESVLDKHVPADLGHLMRREAELLFTQILSDFERTEYNLKIGGFDPCVAVGVAHHCAVGLRGKDSVLVRFFAHLACDVVGQSVDLQECLNYARSSLKSDEKDKLLRRVYDWATFLLNAFFAPFKAQGEKYFFTPPNFEPVEGYSDHGTIRLLANLRQRCLERDHQRCIVTRRFNLSLGNEMMRRDRQPRDMEGNLLTSNGNRFGNLQVAHIMPHSMNKMEPGEKILRKEKRSLRDVLNMFDPGVLTQLEGSDIDHPRNAISLSLEMHALFGELLLSFEPAGTWSNTEQTYNVIKYTQLLPDEIPEQITLYRDSPVSMPSRRLLELHAACARMCHLCGAAGYVDKLRENFESRMVKADGTSKLDDMVMARLAGMQVSARLAR